MRQKFGDSNTVCVLFSSPWIPGNVAMERSLPVTPFPPSLRIPSGYCVQYRNIIRFPLLDWTAGSSARPLLVGRDTHFCFHLHLDSVYRKGESDSMGVHRAQTYYERFETLVKDIRGLGYPDLKIFTVAVTGSIFPRLSFLRQVRWVRWARLSR